MSRTSRGPRGLRKRSPLKEQSGWLVTRVPEDKKELAIALLQAAVKDGWIHWSGWNYGRWPIIDAKHVTEYAFWWHARCPCCCKVMDVLRTLMIQLCEKRG